MPSLLPSRRGVLVAALAGAAVLTALGGAPARAASGPTSSVLPTIAGPPTQGARLVASPGSWTGSGRIAYAFQWYRCDTMGARCVPLRGVTERIRRIAPTDVGHTLSLEVRATDTNGTTTAYASLVGPIAGKPALLAVKKLPFVSGDSVLGGTVHVDPGRWSPPPTAFSVQWARCDLRGRACAPIGGATTATHEVAAADLGHPLVAIVQVRSRSATRAVFTTATPTAVAQHGEAGPSITGVPLVATVVQQGQKLNGASGSWSGSGALRYGYQWYRCDTSGAHCKAIRGATAPTYTPVAKDVGQTLGFAVRAHDVVGASTALASLVGPVAASGAALVSTAQPAITGVATQGQTLQVSTGGWTQTPSAFGYQWQRCNANGRLCTPIAGATAPSYLTTGEDVGHALVAVVHAAAGDTAQDTFSGATRPIGVAPGPSNSAAPVATGTLQQRKQLTASAGTWSGSGAIAYAYQWYRCDLAGAHCKSIHGATKATYTLGRRDVGQTLGLAVHATDATGTATAYGALVGPVAGAGAKLVATGPPVVTGTPSSQGGKLQVAGGSWNLTPTAFAYQWQRCNANGRLCAAIPGAVGSSYAPAAGDVGYRLLAVVQAVANGLPQATLSTTTTVVT